MLRTICIYHTSWTILMLLSLMFQMKTMKLLKIIRGFMVLTDQQHPGHIVAVYDNIFFIVWNRKLESRLKLNKGKYKRRQHGAKTLPYESKCHQKAESNNQHLGMMNKMNIYHAFQRTSCYSSKDIFWCQNHRLSTNSSNYEIGKIMPKLSTSLYIS